MKSNPTVIGAFILGGLALAVGALLAFGSAEFITPHTRAVAYFRGSVQGLALGARVEFRGVPVGKVSEIKLEIDIRDQSAIIPVMMELNPHAASYIGGARKEEMTIESAVARGLRAELAQQSFVTGQMVVELDLKPDTPAVLYRPKEGDIPEIPTIKSDIEQLKDVLSGLPLRSIAASLDKAAAGFDRLLASPELPGMLKDLAATASSANSLMGGLKDDRAKLVADVRSALAALEKAAVGLQGVSADARQSLKTIDQVTTTDLRKALRSADATLQQAERTFSEAGNMLSPESQDRVELSRILHNMSYAIHSLRDFADELQRKPNAVLFGK
jgi:paraquat-inducible protein B